MQRLRAVVAVGVFRVGPEDKALPSRGRMRFPVDLEREIAVEHVEDLHRPREVRLCLMDVVHFWAGDGFAVCSPKLIGRTLVSCHPKRAHAAIEAARRPQVGQEG